MTACGETSETEFCCPSVNNAVDPRLDRGGRARHVLEVESGRLDIQLSPSAVDRYSGSRGKSAKTDEARVGRNNEH